MGRVCLSQLAIFLWDQPVNAVDASALVVAAQDEEFARVFDLVAEEQAERFHTLLA